MGEDAGGGADEVGTAGVVGDEGHNDDGGVGQGDLAGHGRPAGEGRALHAKEQEDAAEEALDAAALAQLGFGPGGREAGEVFGSLGVEGDDAGGSQGGVDPLNQREPPIGGVEAHHARAQMIEGDSGREQRLGAGGVMAIGGGQAKEEGQAGAAAEQGMDTVAVQEGGGMMSGGVTMVGIGISAAPGHDRGAVDDQVARAHDAPTDGFCDDEHDEHLAGRGSGPRRALPLLRGAGHPERAVGAGRQAAGDRACGPRAQPVGHGARRETPECAQQRDQQQRLLAVAARGATRPRWQGRGAAALGLLDRPAAQREQMQARHEREGVDVQSRATFSDGALLCGGWDRGRGRTRCGDHGLTSYGAGTSRALAVSLHHLGDS